MTDRAEAGHGHGEDAERPTSLPSRGAGARAAAMMPTIAVVLVATTVALGIALRVRLLDAGSLWLDELWTLDAVSRSFKEMVGARLVSDQSPPAWTSLTWLWLRTAGTYDASTMRALAAAFGALAIAAPLVGAARMRALRPTLLVMAALTALSLLSVQYSVEMRAYSFTMAAGSVATVIWAGLLTGNLPKTWRWIFAMAFAGAVGGFAHYYGNMLYAGLLVVLTAVWLRLKPRRPLYVLVGWGAVSLVPVSVWFLVTRRWSPGIAVAPEPGLGEIKTWTQYSYAPVTNLLAGQRPGYADGSPATGLVILALVVLTLGVGLVISLTRRRLAATVEHPPIGLGIAALGVVVVAVGAAWTISLILPPSMNTRNLSAVVPALFLATACAVTVARGRTVQWAASTVVVASLLAAFVTYTLAHGATALAPPWHVEAGYRTAAGILVASQGDDSSPRLVGLKQVWDWHGDWDAVLRSETGAAPAAPSDPEPLEVQWVLDAADPTLEALRGRPLIAFAYASDARATDLMAWAEATSGSCAVHTFGGPGVGIVLLADCR